MSSISYNTYNTTRVGLTAAARAVDLAKAVSTVSQPGTETAIFGNTTTHIEYRLSSGLTAIAKRETGHASCTNLRLGCQGGGDQDISHGGTANAFVTLYSLQLQDWSSWVKISRWTQVGCPLLLSATLLENYPFVGPCQPRPILLPTLVTLYELMAITSVVRTLKI